MNRDNFFLCLAGFAVIIALLLVVGPFTGFFGAGQLESKIQILDVHLENDARLGLSLNIPEESFQLVSFKASGNFEGEGNAKIYLNSSSGRYLIFDSNRLSEGSGEIVSGFAVDGAEVEVEEPEPEPEPEPEVVEEPEEPDEEPEAEAPEVVEEEPVEEAEEEVAEESEDQTEESEEVEEPETEVAEEPEAEEVEEDEEPEAPEVVEEESETNESGADIEVNDSVEPVEIVEESVEEPEVVEEPEPAEVPDVVSFDDVCLESCLISNVFNESEYDLLVEIEGDASLRIDSVEYSYSVVGAENESEENLSLLVDIPMIRITAGGIAQVDLSNYFDGAESYKLAMSNVSVEFDGAVATLRPDNGFRGARLGKFVAYNGDLSLESNEFNVLVSSGQVTIETSRSEIKLGEPVKWVKNVSLETPEELTVELPEEATEIVVKKSEGDVDEEIDAKVSRVTGAVVSSGGGLFGSFRSMLKITGFAVQTGAVDAEQTVEILLEENATEYVIEYETEAPQATEEETGNGKRVVISGPDDLNYTNVLSFANIREVFKVGEEDRIQIYWVEDGSYVPFDAYDLDGNSYLDYVEWITPHLSTQTFVITFNSNWDTFVAGNAANTNYGTNTNLEIRKVSPKKSVYLLFDISNITSDNTIDNAEACLYLHTDAGDQNISLHHVYNWAGQNETSITWNNQPCGTDFDNATNCNLTAESNASTNTALDNTWLCWNATETTSKAYSDGSDNVSLILRTGDAGSADKFYSRENLTFVPYLNVSYSSNNDTTNPDVSIVYPENTTYASNQRDINYTVTDSNLDTCKYSLDGGETNVSVTCGNNVSGLNSSEGSNTWTVYVNDTFGNVNSSSVTFVMDSIFPNLTLSEPNGTKDTRNNLNLTFSVADDNLGSCLYNVYRGSNEEVANTSIACGSGSGTFNVTLDADFTLNFYVNDTAGNLNSSSSDFTITTSSGGSSSGSSSSSGGGGGGGGGGSSILSSSNGLILAVTGLDTLSFRGGMEKIVNVSVTNKHISFLNGCSASVNGSSANWFSNGDVKNIGRGERVEYAMALKIPIGARVGEHSSEFILNCGEGVGKKEFTLVVYKDGLYGEVVDYDRVGNRLNVSYTLQDFEELGGEVSVSYKVIDLEGFTVLEGEEKVLMIGEGVEEFSFEADLPKNSFGEFDLIVEFSNGEFTQIITKGIFLPTGGVTGQAFAEANRKVFSVIGIIVGSVLILFFVVKFILRHNRRTGRYHKSKRRFIELEL